MGTKPGTLLKTQIPLQGNAWDISQPGFMEADTVAHCGNSLAGDFAWSLTMTDLCSGWTECRAVWNKGATGVLAQIQAITAALPFSLRGFDCDNGSEFLNWHLLRYFQEPPRRIQFRAAPPHPVHPLPPLPQERQRPRRAEKLVLRPPTVRLLPL